jgi:hypothetical protein
MLLYGIADLAFVGGSLVERGGHNPLEPAARHSGADGAAHVQLQRYLRQAAAGRWPDYRHRRDSLVKEVSNLLTDEDYRLWYGRHAVEVLHQNQGALASATVTATLSAAAEPLMSTTVRRDDRQKRGGPAAGLSGLGSWADEIVLLDSGSSDNTVELARSLGAFGLYQRDWQGYGIQRQRARTTPPATMC